MIPHSTRYRNGVYSFTSHKQAIEAFKTDHRLKAFTIPLPWIAHWKRDYSKEPGILKIGYTAIRNVILVQPKNRAKPGVEMLIQCEEGYISREEAIGLDWVPSPHEIREAAKLIRETNEAIGNIRNADMVGFDLYQVVECPTLIF